MPMPWSSHRDVDPATVRRARRTSTPQPGVGVLHGVVDQVVDRRDELAAVADAARGAWAGSSTSMVIPRCSAAGRMPVDRLGDEVADGDRLADAAPRSASIRRQLEQVVDGAADAERLGHHRSARRRATAGSSSSASVSASSAERADGRLQLVADVGDEVAADGLEAAPP